MLSGCRNFLCILPHLGRIFGVPVQKGGKAQNGVHRRPDIVGHIGQEHALGLICAVGLHQSVLQQIRLFHFVPGFLVHAPGTQHNGALSAPVPRPDRLQLEIPHGPVDLNPIIGIVRLPGSHLQPQGLPGSQAAQHGTVVGMDIALDIPPQAFLQHNFAVENIVQIPAALVGYLQGPSNAAVQVEVAHQAVINAQSLHQFHLPPFALGPFLRLLLLLHRDIQQEALIEQFTVFLHQLDIPHHMKQPAVLMPHPVLHVYAVPHLVKGLNICPQTLLVFLQNRRGHHLEPVLLHLFLRLVAKNFQRGPVYAQNMLSVQRMAHHAAVHSGKNGLQRMGFLDNLLFVSPLLGNIDSHAHGTHHAAVQIVQGRLVCSQQPFALAGLDHFL